MTTVTRTALSVEVADYRQDLKDFGTCLHFPGSAGSINMGTGNLAANGDFYFSAWVKWYGTNGAYQHIFAKRDSYDVNNMMFDLALKDTTGAIITDTTVGLREYGYILPKFKWVHLVWVHNVTDGFEQIYINGERVSQLTISTLGNDTSALILIGATQSPSTEWFNGRIDEVVIGQSAPRWDDVVAMYAKYRYPSQWAFLKLDEGSGTTATDSSGNGNNGTIADATYVTDKVLTTRSAAVDRFSIQNIGKSAYFTASAGRLLVPITPNVTNFNFGLWFNRRNQGQFAHFVSWVNPSATTHGFTLSTLATGLSLNMYNNGSTTVALTITDIFLTSWYHIAVTFTTNSLKVYINGVLRATDTSCSMDTTNPSQTLTVGKRSDANTSQVMAFCDFVWANRSPWTQQEITNLYYNGVLPSGTQVHYKMNENTGTTAIDYSGNGNNGTYSSVAWLSESPSHLLGLRSSVPL